MRNIRLNEHQLRSLVNESVKLVLKELFDSDSDYVFGDDKPDELLARIADSQLPTN